MVINRLNTVLDLDEAILHWLNQLSDQGILTTDANLNIYSWNHWLEIHTGIEAKKVIGRNLLEVYPEIVTRRLERFYRQALEGQVVILSQRLHGYLLPMPPSAGNAQSTQMQQSVRIAPLTTNGKTIGILTVIEDVSERVEREAMLQEQIEELKHTQENLRQIATENLRLAQAVNSASNGVMIVDPNQLGHPIIYVNAAFSRITGYQPHEAIGRNGSFLQGKDTDPQILAQIDQAIAEGREITATLLNYRKEGQTFWNELKMSPVFSEAGNLIYFIGILTDVSDRHLAEQKIAEQAALLDIATDAILVQDLNNRIVFWNKAAEHLYGWSAAEVLNQKADWLLYKERLPQLAEAQKSVLESGAWQGELQQIAIDGKPLLVQSRWTLVRDEKEQPKSILIVNTDITEKKQMEAQFLRAQRMESIGTLAGGIAHDLNNVLTPILMAAQLLKSGLPPEKSDQLLTLVEENTKRGAKLIKQVLSFARGIQGDRTTLQMGHLIREIREIAKETFPKSIQVCIDIPQDLWMISGDPTQLHQVLLNLVVNARDAMPHGGILSVSAENIFIDEHYAQMHIDAKVGAYIVVTVADIGMGIPKEVRDRIFEPFFTTKEFGKGTGLGLSTVLGIVRSHNGFINVESNVGQGTQFKVYLPAVQSKDCGQVLPDLELARGHGELILLVDDEIYIQEIIKTTLQNYDYRVLTAGDGIDALALYAQYKDEISIVLLDMMMPIVDGKTTIRALQKFNSQVKIIATSGLSSNEMMLEAKSLGVKTFLAKPYTAEELLKRLNKCIKE